jgi:hypothetical protein
MRIDGWRVDGFGVFAGASVDDLPPGLTVVSGPNEAGKSTLPHPTTTNNNQAAKRPNGSSREVPLRLRGSA